jgi:hypothetical protein
VYAPRWQMKLRGRSGGSGSGETRIRRAVTPSAERRAADFSQALTAHARGPCRPRLRTEEPSRRRGRPSPARRGLDARRSAATRRPPQLGRPHERRIRSRLPLRATGSRIALGYADDQKG